MTIKDDDYTGCGISPLATGKKDPFHEACAWHDKTYTENSWHQTSLGRKVIDKLFLVQMLLIAGDSWGLKLRANIYYRLARIFGARLWEGKDKD